PPTLTFPLKGGGEKPAADCSQPWSRDRTLSGVRGRRVTTASGFTKRTARSTAEEIAAGTGSVPLSPAPLKPSGLASVLAVSTGYSSGATTSGTPGTE